MTKSIRTFRSDDLDRHRFLTEAAAAHLLGISTMTLIRMARRGEGPPRLKLSDRMVRYRLADVEAWVRERERA
jgi:predicted DNA-binding transcriptional regulator AlpA